MAIAPSAGITPQVRRVCAGPAEAGGVISARCPRAPLLSDGTISLWSARRRCLLVPVRITRRRREGFALRLTKSLGSVPQPRPRRSVSLRNDQKIFHSQRAAGPGRHGPRPRGQARPSTGMADQSTEHPQRPEVPEVGHQASSASRCPTTVRKGGRRAGALNARTILPPGQAAAPGRDGVLLPDLMLSPKRAAASLPSVPSFRKDFRASASATRRSGSSRTGTRSTSRSRSPRAATPSGRPSSTRCSARSAAVASAPC